MTQESQMDQPVKLTSVSTEIEAGSLITALAALGVTANAVGGYTAGFRAEAPGQVEIWVRRQDLDLAQKAMVEISAEDDNVDWSKVDVGEPLDEPIDPVTD